MWQFSKESHQMWDTNVSGGEGIIHFQKDSQNYIGLQEASPCSPHTAVSPQEPVVKSADRGSSAFLSRKDPGCSRPAALSPSSRELLARCTRHTAAEMLRLGVQLATKGGQSESSLPRLALPLSNERARGSEKPEAGEGEAPDRSWDRRPARRVMLKKEN